MLYAGEITRMIAAENIVNAYRSRDAYRVDGEPNWAQWAERNPSLARILNEVEQVANG